MRAPELEFVPTVPNLLHRSVERFGDRDHVVSASDRLTFADAERRSAILARRLLADGVGKGSRVGIILPSSPDFVVAFLAVARIGAISMMFSSTYRPAELRVAARNADVSVLIAPPNMLGRDFDADLLEAFPELLEQDDPQLRLLDVPYLRSIWITGATNLPWAEAVPLDGSLADLVGDVPLAPPSLLAAVERQVVPADLLLAIFTSGTSAEPKAVLHTHGTAVRKVHPSTGLGLGSSTEGVCVLMAMPFFWVGGPQSLLGSMHVGSKIVSQERFEPGEALMLIERERVTHVAGWPTLVDTLRGHPGYSAADLSSLVAPSRPPKWFSSKGDPINMGMTETFGMHRNPEYFDYQVIDPVTGRPVPEGEEGEFCVRGFGLTAGLYRREREEVFDADGWYHTGDRGYIEEGQIYFTGRYSEMIKSAGANVSPLEVENALISLPGVAAAYVFAIPHPSRGEEVAAVVVSADGKPLDLDGLRAALRSQMSSFKVPARIVQREADDVPRLPSGKPNKRQIAREVAALDSPVSS